MFLVIVCFMNFSFLFVLYFPDFACLFLFKNRLFVFINIVFHLDDII